MLRSGSIVQFCRQFHVACDYMHSLLRPGTTATCVRPSSKKRKPWLSTCWSTRRSWRTGRRATEGVAPRRASAAKTSRPVGPQLPRLLPTTPSRLNFPNPSPTLSPPPPLPRPLRPTTQPRPLPRPPLSRSGWTRPWAGPAGTLPRGPSRPATSTRPTTLRTTTEAVWLSSLTRATLARPLSRSPSWSPVRRTSVPGWAELPLRVPLPPRPRACLSSRRVCIPCGHLVAIAEILADLISEHWTVRTPRFSPLKELKGIQITITWSLKKWDLVWNQWRYRSNILKMILEDSRLDFTWKQLGYISVGA